VFLRFYVDVLEQVYEWVGILSQVLCLRQRCVYVFVELLRLLAAFSLGLSRTRDCSQYLIYISNLVLDQFCHIMYGQRVGLMDLRVYGTIK
jgi:hypothetical protein